MAATPSRRLVAGSELLATPGSTSSGGGGGGGGGLTARQRAELMAAVADFLDGSGYVDAGAALRREAAARGDTVPSDGGTGTRGLLERRWAAVVRACSGCAYSASHGLGSAI